MPSFDIVSEVDDHELTNAVDQANREIANRFDFKGVKASFNYADGKVTMLAEVEFQLQQMLDILKNKCVKRDISVECLDPQKPSTNLSEAKQEIIVKQGIDKELAKKITKLIKDQKLKVQTSIQGEQVRVTGKKRDDLQDCIATLKEAPIDMPLQYTNFRD